MESKKNLYIIGNGFDLHHGLKTNYSDFHTYISQNKSELEWFLENYFDMKTNDNYLWNNFESDLGTFNYKLFFDEINELNPMDDDFRPSFCFSLEDDIITQTEDWKNNIRNAFHDWIATVQEETSPNPKKAKLLPLDKQSLFLSFNYTDTLTRLYQIESSKILHIHNSIQEGELVFGHNIELPEVVELDENGNSNRTMFTDSESAAKYLISEFKKPVDAIINQHSDCFNKLNDISEIIILGHSLNEIDMPYYKKIVSIVDKSTIWKVSYYHDNEAEKFKVSLLSIGIEDKRIKFFKLEDF